MKPRCTVECAEDFKRIETEKAALVMAAVKPRVDFRWLIEAPGARYLTVQRLSGSNNFEWTADHNRALAFRTQDQADAMMMAVRQMDRQINGFDKGLFAFEASLGNAKAVGVQAEAAGGPNADEANTLIAKDGLHCRAKQVRA